MIFYAVYPNSETVAIEASSRAEALEQAFKLRPGLPPICVQQNEDTSSMKSFRVHYRRTAYGFVDIYANSQEEICNIDIFDNSSERIVNIEEAEYGDCEIVKIEELDD